MTNQNNDTSPLPSWWQAGAAAADDVDDAVSRYFAPSGPASADAGQDQDEDDDALPGMPLDQLADGNVGHLKALDEEIARLEAELRKHGMLSGLDHLEGDDDDEGRKKRFMTIKDLKPTPIFDLLEGGGGSSAAPPPPDAVLETGRRLKDGAAFPAVRAPLLFGVKTPIYVHDLLLPLALWAGAFCLLLGYCWADRRRVRHELEAARQSNAELRGALLRPASADEQQIRKLIALLSSQTASPGIDDHQLRPPSGSTYISQ